MCDVCHVLQEIEEVGKFNVEFQNNLTHFENGARFSLNCASVELVTVMSLLGHEQVRSSKNVHEVDTLTKVGERLLRTSGGDVAKVHGPGG